MAPSFMRRKESETELDEDIVAQLIAQLEEEPAKPWTVVSRVSDQLDQDPDEVRETLRQLALQGKITPTADGDLRKALVEA
jgi:negative regulator of sigma E activity